MQEIAAQLNVSPKTLYRCLKKYDIPYDGELISKEKAKNIMDIITKSPSKSSEIGKEDIL